VPFVFVYGPSLLIVTKGFTWTDFIVTTSVLAGLVIAAPVLVRQVVARRAAAALA
jgi:hypothetical protein